jgi:DNA polymerase-3 subunit chi
MTEVLFYHLETQPLERVLPTLLERCQERGWRVCVQTGSEERRDALDQHLWTYLDNSFLPHGTARDGDPTTQPIYLTAEPENPNAATVRFLVDRAEPPDIAGYERAVFIFDGNDPEALAEARQRWKTVKATGHTLSYWQQEGGGKWVKKA